MTILMLYSSRYRPVNPTQWNKYLGIFSIAVAHSVDYATQRFGAPGPNIFSIFQHSFG